MKHRTLLAMVLSLIMCLGMSLPAWAAEEDNTLTFEEYEERFQAACAEQGIQCRIRDYDKDTVFTQELIDRQIRYLSNLHIAVDDVETSLSETVGHSNTVKGGYMPVEQNYYKNKTIRASVGLGTTTICMQLKALVNSQNGDLMEVISVKSYPNGGASYFSGWEVFDDETIITPNYNNDTVYVSMTGLATFIVTDEGVNFDWYDRITIDNTFYI